MALQPLMGATKASFWVLLAVLFTVAVSSNDREEPLDVYLSQLLDPTSGLLDEDTAELIWTSCGLDLIHLKEDIEDLDLCFPQEASGGTNEINSEIRSLAQKNIQKLVSAHLPQLKQILLHCLRKNSLPFRVTGEDNQPKILRVPYLKSPFPRFSATRRNLGLEFPQHISDASSRSRTPPSSTPLSRRRLSSDSSSASRNASTARSLKAKTKEKESDTQTTIIAAVVITASVTFIVAALLFMCCSKCCRNGRVRKNDERPLLSLSMSDYSVGSSHRSFANSIKEEKLGFQTSSNSLLDDKNTSSLNGSFHIGSDVLHTTVQENQSIGDAVATVNPPIVLKPPPGRVVNNSTGLPPLKPPPGRPDLLPPEPPLRPSNAAVPPAVLPVVPPAAPSAAPPPPPAPPQPRKPARVGGAPTAGPPPPPPPARPGARTGPSPPPPPRSGPGPPRPPPPIGPKLGRPAANKPKIPQNVVAEVEVEPGVPKTKLKPFFWDKVQANSDSAMVWNQLKAGSFQFNEEMIESLFGYVNTTDKNKGERKKESAEALPQYIQIIDSKKSQNLSILLKALNVTMEEVCDALFEGNELPSEFLQTLLKMAPTQEEELKLRLYNGELSRLGPADRFLKALVEVPFAYKRLDVLLYMGTLQEDLTSTMESFEILEVACKELRSSRLFLKLLEAVLKTGNRMNDGTFRGGALAFKLDTLLKLSDVKGVDGKITLLHFVVQEIIRSEGIRAARVAKESRSFSSIKTDDLLDDIPHESPERYRELGLEVVSRLSSELENVKKAAALDADSLTGTAAKLGHGLVKTKEFLNTDLQNLDGDRGFYQTVKSFVQSAEDDVLKLLEEEKKIMNLVKSTGDYFHGNSGRDEGLRLFSIVRDFLVMLDKVCKEIRDAAQKKAAKPVKQETARASSSSELRPPPSPDIRQKLFPANSDKRMDDFSSSSSSDDDSP